MESMYSVAGYISVPDPDLEINKGGGGGGRAVIQTLLVSVWSKNKGGVRPSPPGPTPGSAPVF